jgi:hypothetical protein
MNYKVLVAAALAATAVHAAEIDEKLPQPWFKNGAAPAVQQCTAGVDVTIEQQGTRNMTLKCDATVEGFVGVMQSFSADEYRGKRVQFSALVKSDGIEGWGGLWMRIDEAAKPGVAFDNMQNRAIKGTTDWTPYSVVLDVSPNAQGIFFGTLMSGKGQLWISNLRLDQVLNNVATTSVSPPAQTRPGNLELSR